MSNRIAILMFKEPEKHVVVGITKTRTVADIIGDASDILSVAQGENDEIISFKGYKLVVVEQDDVESLQGMILAVQEQGCARRFAR